MCTISWLVTETGYEVVFNRDEQRQRQHAIAPQLERIQQTGVILPIDPQGGGSWISVNEHGLSLCLLNYYQGVKLQGTQARSRGLLVKDLSYIDTIEALLSTLYAIDLAPYSAFTLLVFSRDHERAASLQWDGQTLKRLILDSPFTSSSVDYEQVLSARMQAADALIKTRIKTKPACIDELLNYHKSHLPSKSQQSVCMHREDAKTVSLSHIIVDTKNAFFDYYPGSPCSPQPRTHREVKLTTREPLSA